MLSGLLSGPDRPVFDMKPNFVARTTWSRRPFRARPTSFLVRVGAVHLGRVDERDAELERPVNRSNGFGVVAARSRVGGRHAHGAQTNAADVE